MKQIGFIKVHDDVAGAFRMKNLLSIGKFGVFFHVGYIGLSIAYWNNQYPNLQFTVHKFNILFKWY